MDESRYTPPMAVVTDVPEEEVVPAAVLKKIRNAWIASLISAGVTLVIALVVLSGTKFGPFTGAELVDVGLILALAFGISRKSRTCAVAMLLYFVLSKAMLIRQTGQLNGLFLGAVLLYYYVLGVVGTFEYHRLRKR